MNQVRNITLMLIDNDADDKCLAAFSIEATKPINMELLETRLKEVLAQLGFSTDTLVPLTEDDLRKTSRREYPDHE